MEDLTALSARRCLTAAALLIHQNQVLLIKHKKLQIWLIPGGHVDEHELPHQAAERECFEETGIVVKAINNEIINGQNSQYLPNPVLTNLHWVSQENYHARLSSPNPQEPRTTPTWPRGCEQHYTFVYLVQPAGVDLTLVHNLKETEGLRWFKPEEINSLDTTADIKAELHYAFARLADYPYPSSGIIT